MVRCRALCVQSLNVVLSLSASCLLAAFMFVAAPWTRAQANSVDITGLKLQLRAVAPDRDTGKPVTIPLPSGLLGAKMSGLLAIPLSTQLDTYWNTRDPKTGMTPREDACNGKDKIVQQVQQAVRKIGSGYNAYDVSCHLASGGNLFATQSNSDLTLAYLLRDNSVHFTVTTPATCHAGHGTFLCPDDPQFNVAFDTGIVTVVHTRHLCQLTAENGAINTQNVKIGGTNPTGALAQVLDDLILGHKFSAAEQAVESTRRNTPLPLDGELKELRESDACSGRNPVLHRALAPFRTLDTLIELPQGVILQARHAGISAPSIDAPDPWSSAKSNQPTFTRPMISANQPLVVVGSSLHISGQYFPHNFNAPSFANQLPLTFSLATGYVANSIILGEGVCWGGFTEVRWSLMGMSLVHRDAQAPSDADGGCAKGYEVNNLIPANTYDFRARDCDKITCSPWSAPLRRRTAAAGGTGPGADKGTITLIIDRNAECKAPWCGPARNSELAQRQGNVVAPATDGIPTSGACNTPLCRVGMSSSTAKAASDPPPSTCNTPICRSAHISPAMIANATNSGCNGPWCRHAQDSAPAAKMPVPLGSAVLTPQGTFVTSVTIPSGLAPGNHTISALNGDAEADLAITVAAPNSSRGPYIMLIAIVAAGESGCPNRPSSSVLGDTNFMLFGTGFEPGSVSVYADKPMGTRPLGTATVHADGTFCEQMRGISGRELGPHTLLAVENGAVQAQAAITVVPPTHTQVN